MRITRTDRLTPHDAVLLGLGSMLTLLTIAFVWSSAIVLRDAAAGAAAGQDAYRSVASTMARGLVYWGIRAALAPVAVLVFQWIPPSRRTSGMHVLVFLLWSSTQSVVQASVAVARWKMSHGAILWSIGANALLNLAVYAAIGAGWVALRNHRLATERAATEARVRRELVETRFGSLRAQLNPDLVLFALEQLPRLAARGDFAAAVRVISRLGELLRATLETRNDATIDLASELTMTGLLVDVRRAVDGTDITYETDAKPEVLTAGVPPFVLQTLVDAAVEDGARHIRVSGAVEHEVLNVRVTTSGASTSSPERMQRAAELLRERLFDVSLRVFATEERLTAEILLPMRVRDDALATTYADKRDVTASPSLRTETIRTTAPLDASDARRLLAAVFAGVAALAVVDLMNALVSTLYRPAPNNEVAIGMWLQTWPAMFLLVPLIVGILWRVPLTLRTLPLHVAAPFALAGLQIAVTALLPSPGAHLPFLALPTTPVVAAIHVLIYTGAAIGCIALARHRDAVRRAESEELLLGELTRARLAVLQAQLNPHFLFNTLNSISTLALRRDAEGVTSAARKLADLLRYALEQPESVETDLAHEGEAVDRYLQIQKLRFGDRLRAELDFDVHTLGLKVPRMILQPIVENAVIHGVAPRIGGGRIRIGSSISGHSLTLTVEDDGVGLETAARSGKGFGLENARTRLRSIYGPAAEVHLEALKEGGTRAEITIPIRHQEVS